MAKAMGETEDAPRPLGMAPAPMGNRRAWLWLVVYLSLFWSAGALFELILGVLERVRRVADVV